MIWTGPLHHQHSERDGRSLEIRKHTDGTWRLLVWKSLTSSAIVGIFSAPEVARVAAEKMPLDDESLSKLMKDPHAAMKERWQMTDLPIMMSAPMILATLREVAAQGTGKQMTRRLATTWRSATKQERVIAATTGGTVVGDFPSFWTKVQVGDRLWVRENFWRYGRWSANKKAGKTTHSFQALPLIGIPNMFFAAENSSHYEPACRFGQSEPGWCLRPNIFLPRPDSRLTLIVTSTKIERLWDISEQDCEREGVMYVIEGSRGVFFVDGLRPETYTTYSYQDCFKSLWKYLHGPSAWDANPVVVAIGFRPVLANIDTPEAKAA